MKVIGFAVAVLLGVICWSGQGVEAKIKRFQDKEGTLHITNEGEEEQKKPVSTAPAATTTMRQRRHPPPGVERPGVPRPSAGAFAPPEGGPPPAPPVDLAPQEGGPPPPESSLKSPYPESAAKGASFSHRPGGRPGSPSRACFSCQPPRMTS